MQKPECNFVESLSYENKKTFRNYLIKMVLATDNAFHIKHLGTLEKLLSPNEAGEIAFNINTVEHEIIYLETVLHSADVSNPTSKFDDECFFCAHKICVLLNPFR